MFYFLLLVGLVSLPLVSGINATTESTVPTVTPTNSTLQLNQSTDNDVIFFQHNTTTERTATTLFPNPNVARLEVYYCFIISSSDFKSEDTISQTGFTSFTASDFTTQTLITTVNAKKFYFLLLVGLVSLPLVSGTNATTESTDDDGIFFQHNTTTQRTATTPFPNPIVARFEVSVRSRIPLTIATVGEYVEQMKRLVQDSFGITLQYSVKGLRLQ